MIREIGPHRVRHGDVTDASAFTELMEGRKADIMYVDPPWGTSAIKLFATLNEKHTGDVIVPSDLDTLLGSIFVGARDHVKHYMVVEYGIRWRDQIQEAGLAAMFTPLGVYPVHYGTRPKSKGGGSYPMDLHLFGRTPDDHTPAGWATAVTGAKGYPCVLASLEVILRSLKGLDGRRALVLDPCCGMGYTAKASLHIGADFYGNELNLKRLASTVSKLRASV